VFDLLHDSQRERFAQDPQLTRGQLRKTFGRRDARTPQDLGQRGEWFGPSPAAKRGWAYAAWDHPTLQFLSRCLEPEAGELGVGGTGLAVAVGLSL